MRTIHIVRFNYRYPDYVVVCDRCGKPLDRGYHYRVFDDGEECNDYPFHTQNCARLFIREEYTSDPYDEVTIMDGTKDFFQEEVTED